MKAEWRWRGANVREILLSSHPPGGSFGNCDFSIFLFFIFFIFFFKKIFCAQIHGHCFTTEAGCHISSDFIWFWAKAGISVHLRLAAHGAHMVGRWGPMWGPHRQTLGCTTPGWTQRVGPPSFKPPRGLWRCQYLTNIT